MGTKRSLPDKKYVGTHQELEAVRDDERQKGNMAYKCMLGCDCQGNTINIARTGYKIYYPGNDSLMADEIYLLCPNCAKK